MSYSKFKLSLIVIICTVSKIHTFDDMTLSAPSSSSSSSSTTVDPIYLHFPAIDHQTLHRSASADSSQGLQQLQLMMWTLGKKIGDTEDRIIANLHEMTLLSHHALAMHRKTVTAMQQELAALRADMRKTKSRTFRLIPVSSGEDSPDRPSSSADSSDNDDIAASHGKRKRPRDPTSSKRSSTTICPPKASDRFTKICKGLSHKADDKQFDIVNAFLQELTADETPPDDRIWDRVYLKKAHLLFEQYKKGITQLEDVTECLQEVKEDNLYGRSRGNYRQLKGLIDTERAKRQRR